MGTCVSKCCSCYPPVPLPPPDGYHSRRLLHVEKVVVSKSPPPTLPVHGEFSIKHKVLMVSSTDTTTSSLISTSSSAAAAAASSSSSSTSINSFPQPSLIHKPKEDPEIVVLDPQRHGAGAPKTAVRCSQRMFDQTCKPVGAISIPKQAFVLVNQPFLAKRSRSSSPSVGSGRKSFRSENRQGATVPPPPRNSSNSSSPLPSSRSKMTNPRQRSRYIVESPAGNVISSTRRKENVRPLRSCSSQGRRHLRMEKETFVHHIQLHQERHATMHDQSENDGEVFDNPLVEDLNNPLIALDCFIFI